MVSLPLGGEPRRPQVVRKLPRTELQARARRIALVLSDCDGVLTDAGVYYSVAGEELRRFSVRDGMAVERLRNAGIAFGIMSGEDSPSIAARAAKLRLPHVLLGIKDKAACLDDLLHSTRLQAASVAYIGDDLNDAGLLARQSEVALTAVPADAVPEMAPKALYRCSARGGHGALREFADWILRLRGAALEEERP